MSRSGRRLLAAALVAAASAAARAAPYPAPANYTTFCAVIDATTVEGFVTNNGEALLQLAGLIRYSVAGDYTASRPAVQTQSSALIPPGTTRSLGRARMPSALLPGETCQLDIAAALR